MNKLQKNQRIKAAKSNLLDQLALAQDEIPGGKFDEAVAEALLSLRVLNDPKANIQLPDGGIFDWKAFAKDSLFNFGRTMAEAIERKDSSIFSDMAATIDKWRDHKPKPDKRRAAFIEILRSHKAKEVEDGKPLKLSMLTVIECLVSKGIIQKKPKSGDYINLATTLRRWGNDMGVIISGASGRPKK